MNPVVLGLLKSFSIKVLLYALKISKEKFTEIGAYTQRVEFICEEFKLAIEENEFNIPSHLANDFRDYECDLFQKIWNNMKSKIPVSSLKRDLVSKFIHVKYGITGKVVNFLVELVILASE